MNYSDEKCIQNSSLKERDRLERKRCEVNIKMDLKEVKWGYGLDSSVSSASADAVTKILFPLRVIINN